MLDPWPRRCVVLLAALLLHSCVTSALWQSDRLLLRSDRRLESQTVSDWPPGDVQLRRAGEHRDELHLSNSPTTLGGWVLRPTRAGAVEHLLARLPKLPDAPVRIELVCEWLDGELAASYADVVVASGIAGAQVPIRAFRRPPDGGYQARWQMRKAGAMAERPGASVTSRALEVRLIERRFRSQDPNPEWQKLALTPLAVAVDCVVTVPLIGLAACGLSRLPAGLFVASASGESDY